jgi:general secretion pathway protein A
VYTEFFGLNEKPFSITPDPRYLYMSARHADALAHLIYGISESGGFIQLTGEVGTGKTTLIRSLLEQLPAKAEIALILNPQLSTKEFLQAICEELRVPAPQDDSVKARIDALNAYLLKVHADGRRVVLIVDEAQTLSPELLEQVRLLTNLETAKQKLLQIILIGQPELRELLDRPEMRQLAQRVTGRYHLEPLTKQDTVAYVRHRMQVAGAQSDVFQSAAIRQLYRSARGIPRLINVVADRALLAAYTQDRRSVDRGLVKRAAREVYGGPRRMSWWRWAGAAIVVLGVLVVGALNVRERSPQNSASATSIETDGAVSGDAATSVAAGNESVSVAADPPAAVPAEARMTLDDLLGNTNSARDFSDATIGELLTLWGAAYDPRRGEACQQAAEQGLRCLTQEKGSLGELRRVNWPAILWLTDAQGKAGEILITSLGYDDAQVVANGRTREIPLSLLSFHWYGKYLLLWRPGIVPPKDLTPGINDSGVLWLRAALARIGGEDVPSEQSPIYDAALEQQVREFQRNHMLTVDGIVGARTQIAMLADLDMPDTPLLLASH